MQKAYSSLVSARDVKKHEIEEFFKKEKSDVEILSHSKDVEELSAELIEFHKKAQLKENETFPAGMKIVKDIYSDHEEFFHKYITYYGYYDLFIVNAKYGHVMYSVSKESDLGANLSYGNLKNSGLAKVWQKVRDSKKVSIVDMAPYAPSGNKPSMFIGAPVFGETNEMNSIVVLQIPTEVITKIMQFRSGYGETQEDYLVGADKLMRSDSFLDPKKFSVEASFNNPSKSSCDTESVREGLNGSSDTISMLDYDGHPVISSFVPVDISEDIKWVLVSDIEEDEVLAEVHHLRNIIIIVALVLFVIIVSIVYGVINSAIITPLEKFQRGLLLFFSFLNKETTNVERLDDSSNDEIGKMSKVVNESITRTKNILDDNNRVIDNAKDIVDRVKHGLYSQTITATTSDTSLEQFKRSVNEMITVTKEHFIEINRVLEQYAHLDYREDLKLIDIDSNGVFAIMVKDINKLRDSITSMLVDNMKTGLTLQDSSETLLSNVDRLNQSSNEAAASLEETAAALEQITGNISNNTENVIKMSNYANELTKSANEGEKLAKDTTTAMTEIDNQVNAINEAITVIDQIAFQTNILSLNAAVEAATAGEAGKGFAVVAQEVRNLASRSAEAANEIKTLVESATNKANDGKKISDKMIDGYLSLNSNISSTLELIKDVEMASKEQQLGIEQINDAVSGLDKQTQENATIASHTDSIAKDTLKISNDIVSSAKEKDFIGKDSIKIEKKSRGNSSVSNTISTSPKKSTPKVATKPVSTPPMPKVTPKPSTPLPANNSFDDDDWESF
jgi:methyl-accepting chemotaxis protein